MGIPSYFSYIIKNPAKIVRRLSETGHIHHLFMDCNSIIYDLFHALGSKDVVVDEAHLIQQIIAKIVHYVKYIRPSKTLMIAFDGVAPLAKMDQQRTRRHKTQWLQSAATASEGGWSTCNITPGTAFMQQLSIQVDAAFDAKFAETHGIAQVIVSAAMECGEGEHKLFQHIRRNMVAGQDTTAAVYGLDSDLIMLSLFHCDRFNKIFVFRETPEFVKSQIPISPEDPCHFLDIGHLCSAILSEMKKTQMQYIYDYVFLCFFLGNDFLPHFPSLNLRTHGLQVLLHTYRKVFSSSQSIIAKDKTIQWKQVHRFIQALAMQEHELWMQEYETRAKWANRKWSTATDQDRDNVLQNVPVIYRAEELYIAPDQAGWQQRYYKALLDHEEPDKVCQNYLDGLAWVFQYYTDDCRNWRWRYQYHYPPLLQDLVKAAFSVTPSSLDEAPPFSPAVQLAYVTPRELHATLLPSTDQHSEAADTEECSLLRPARAFQWAFCRYFWESHIVLPE
jgi:hypothetical protein